jgi:NADH:ubiquinone oxidoreductase subunit E
MEVQKTFGHISDGHAAAIAELLSVPVSEVESVLTFYWMLQEKTTGKYLLYVCGTWNCEHAGANKIKEAFCRHYGSEVAEMAPSGAGTVMGIECLCDCHNAPSILVTKAGHPFQNWWCNNVTVELFETILNELDSEGDIAWRERLVRIEEKQNPPDSRRWVWLVTTNNQYPCWVEQKDGELIVNDGFGKLEGLKEKNPRLFAEIQQALKATPKS